MNIELHGFLPEQRSKLAEEIWKQVVRASGPETISATRLTFMESRSFDHKGKQGPFIRVYSDEKEDLKFALNYIEKAKKTQNLQIAFPVECVHLVSRDLV